ncbi:hypothetical protein Angca_000915, partial [Angiostrongylus cantonensis]
MKSLLFTLLILVVIGVVLSCEKFEKHVNMFCKFSGETNPCLTPNAHSFASSCCASKSGCSSMEFPKDKV